MGVSCKDLVRVSILNSLIFNLLLFAFHFCCTASSHRISSLIDISTSQRYETATSIDHQSKIRYNTIRPVTATVVYLQYIRTLPARAP